jgi:hypothetical protein
MTTITLVLKPSLLWHAYVTWPGRTIGALLHKAGRWVSGPHSVRGSSVCMISNRWTMSLLTSTIFLQSVESIIFQMTRECYNAAWRFSTIFTKPRCLYISRASWIQSSLNWVTTIGNIREALGSDPDSFQNISRPLLSTAFPQFVMYRPLE